MVKKKNSITKRYVKTLGDVYKTEGLLPAIVYELKSTGYSLGKKFANSFDIEPDEFKHEPIKSRTFPYTFKGKAYSNVSWSHWNKRTKKRIKQREDYLLRKEKKDLGSKVSSVVALLGVIGGLFFLSPNLTGNVVANASQTTSSWIGGVLLLIGLVGVYVFVRNK